MNRRDFLAVAGSGAAAMPLGAAPQRPNVLLILGDNQQSTTIANRSVCRTPNINQLADDGMLFHRAYTNAAVGSPARNARLTRAINSAF